MLRAQTSRLGVGMIQRITDIMVVNMRYETEDADAVEVEAKLKSERSEVESYPELSVEHTTAEIRLAVDGMLGQTTVPAVSTSIPRSDVASMRPKGWARLGSRKPFPIARSKDDITADWCTRVFRHQGYLTADERVADLTIKAIGEGEGEFSDLALLTINEVVGGAAPRLPRSMIAKFSPPSVKGIELKIVFGTEAHMYNDVTCTGMQLLRPEAVYIGAEFSRFGRDRYCFLIENCSPAPKPSLMFKRQDGCESVPHLMIAMRGLARFHARWWGASQKAPLDFAFHPSRGGGPLPPLTPRIALTAFALTIKAGLKALPHCYLELPHMIGAPKFGSEFRELLATLLPCIRRRRHAVARELVRPPLTLCHGDAHLENVFFGDQFAGGCMFIDFGLTGFGQPLSDVAMIIGQGMRREVRRAHERSLVAFYHKCLLEFGVTSYSEAQCWRDFQFQLFRPFLSLLTIAPSFARQRKKRVGMFAPNPSEGDKKLYAMYQQINARLASALIDHGFVERVAEFEFTAPPCCRPCC